MYRTERFKLSTYHDHQTGELYDLTNDPNEHRNLWPEPAYRDIRERLTRESFDRLVFALDLGPPQTARN